MKKKKLKGMSLIEIIISLAVMALLSVILLTVGTTIGNTSKATNKLKNKIVQESPYAANRVKGYFTNSPEMADGDDYDEDGNIVDADGKMKYKLVLDVDSNPYTDADGNYMYETALEGDDMVINVIIPSITDSNKAGKFKYLDEDGEEQEAEADADISVKGYNTRPVVEGGPSLSKANENLDLKFIDFVPPTEATTEAST